MAFSTFARMPATAIVFICLMGLTGALHISSTVSSASQRHNLLAAEGTLRLRGGAPANSKAQVAKPVSKTTLPVSLQKTFVVVVIIAALNAVRANISKKAAEEPEVVAPPKKPSGIFGLGCCGL